MICANCKVSVNDVAQCGACKELLCFSCGNVSEGSYRKLRPERKANWKCPSCRSDSPITAKSTASVPASVPADLKKQISLEDIMGKLNEVTRSVGCLPKLSADVVELKSDLQEIRNSCEFMSNRIDEFSSKLKNLDDRVLTLEAARVEVQAAITSVDSVKAQFYNQDQWTRMNNVEIRGIPMKKDENLFKVIEKLGDYIGYQVSKTLINYISRIPTFNSKDKSILLSFVNRYVKEDFVAAARGKKKIATSNLGYSGDDRRIYVNDHLTPQNKNLLNQVKLIAKEKYYSYVWVRYAKIHVRKNDSSPVITVHSVLDLNKLT